MYDWVLSTPLQMYQYINTPERHSLPLQRPLNIHEPTKKYLMNDRSNSKT